MATLYHRDPAIGKPLLYRLAPELPDAAHCVYVLSLKESAHMYYLPQTWAQGMRAPLDFKHARHLNMTIFRAESPVAATEIDADAKAGWPRT